MLVVLAEFLQRIKAFCNSGVIYPQELVHAGNHIHLIWFALGSLFVKEPISRLMTMFVLQGLRKGCSWTLMQSKALFATPTFPMGPRKLKQCN